ncbi:TIR domain-containing protein [Arenimonas sp. MALMAid1274]|uniref:TIR domain-containing protein n=1 Tax=Arenimonas sp. MALMAid1274 TaxID=3411630 RepID=UPI003B9E422F
MSKDPAAPDPAAPRSVFLSYSRADQARARQVADALGQAGLTVWWDSLIEGGASFAKSIETALLASDAVVVLWSATSVASDWVLDEAGHGRDLRKLVPVSIDGTLPPLGFRQYQSIALPAGSGPADPAAVAAVVRAVQSILRGEPAPARGDVPAPRAGAPLPAPAQAGRRRVLIGGAAALALAAGGGVVAWRRGWFAGQAAPSGTSVAVLPFKNISGDAARAYFSDGLSEEVRATLARNLKLQVMAQSSSGQFRAREEDAVGIAGKLGVSYLLDGSVRWAGDTVRVAADLVDGRTGFSRWSQIFERRIDDVFAVQSEIANAVATALAAQVGPEGGAAPDPEAERAASGGTRSVEAFDAYLRGQALYDLSADEASELAALAQFDAAIALDPRYAAAHAARARSLISIANVYGKVGQTAAMYDQAIVSAETAVSLAPQFAVAHSTLAFALFQGRLDARAARVPFERSNTLGAGEATVQARWAQYCARTGRHAEAAQAMQRALARDSLNPLIHRAAGSIEYAARRFEASLAPVRKALAMNPKMSRAHGALGDALVNLGSLDAARAEYDAEPIADFRLAGLAIVAQRLGRAKDARALFDQMVSELGDRVLYQQGQVLAQRGEREAALQALAAARAKGDSGLVYSRNDPFLDPLRDDARLAGLLDSLGFDPA